MKIASLSTVGSTSIPQPINPQPPKTPTGIHFKDNLHLFFNSLVDKSLLVQGIQFSSKAGLEVPSSPPTSEEEVAISDDSIQSAPWPGGERAQQAGQGGI